MNIKYSWIGEALGAKFNVHMTGGLNGGIGGISWGPSGPETYRNGLD